MSASQNKKKTLSLGLALIPVISMLLLLIIGYGIMGLRIEPLLLCSAAVAAGIAWWQGYCWEDIINSVVDKLAKSDAGYHDSDLRRRFDWHLDV
ncbi:sodium/proton antiporter [Salmonella enterica subsp. arizonae]|nr:sodium/proton antiporter [Salmonella enterica subsp. arizonae]